MMSLALQRPWTSLTSKRMQANPRRVISFRTNYKQRDELEARTPWAQLPLESNYSVTGKDEVLTKAEAELGDYCSRFQDPSEAKACWETYWYLKEKHLSSIKGCSAEVKEQGAPASSCDQLEKLEQIIRELESTGKVDDLYHVLALMKRLESSDSAPAIRPTAAKQVSSVDAEASALRKEARQMFAAADTNGDGRLDVAEFRDAMSKMSTALSGQEVAQICSCLDIHGFIELDQFLDIVMAEQTRLQNPDSDAEFLKHVTHLHGHAHDHPSASMW